MSAIKVEVTAEDIRRGKHRSAFTCPIALAVMRASGERDVGVGKDGIHLYPDGGTTLVTCLLPKKAAKFIECFDSDGERWRSVKPFTFTLRRAK